MSLGSHASDVPDPAPSPPVWRPGRARRIGEVELTEEGREAREAAMVAPVAFARDLLKGLNEEEQQALVGLFSKIAERINLERRTA